MIPVYIIPSGNRSVEKNRCKLISFFESCKIFKVVEVCKLKNSIGLSSNAIEVNLIYNALHDSYKDFPDLPCITILDTSTTISSPSLFVSLLFQIISIPNFSSFSESFSNLCSCSSEKSDSCSCKDSSCSSENSESCSCRESENYTNESKNKEKDEKEHKNKEKRGIYKCWDIAYLADWLDRCDLFKPIDKKDKDKCGCNCNSSEKQKDEEEKEKCESEGGQWMKTVSPNGLQALLWSVKGRDIVLGKKCMKNQISKVKTKFPTITPNFSSQLTFNIQNKNLRAITLTPPFFYFDITNCKLTLSDLNKVSQCRIPAPPDQPVTILPYLIFISVVVLVLLLAWFFYQVYGKYH